MRHRPAAAGTAAGLLALSALLSACSGSGAAPVAQERAVLVVRPAAADGDAASYAAEVRARAESTLAFRVGGNLIERRVEVGDRVRAGQVLALLDAGDFEAQARATQAQLAAAQAQLARARADRARFAALAQDQLVSRSAVDAQNAAAAAAEGQVNAARANLDVARNQAGYAQLRAPRDGVIAARHAEAGQVVAPGQPVFTLAGDGTREVVFAVAESVVGSLRPGHPVEIELWSQPGTRRSGRIREVAPAADPASRTYAVRAGIDGAAEGIELGQSARVRIAASGAAKPMIAVPLAAVQRGREGAAVFVVDAKTSALRLQPVRVGPFGEDSVTVLDGLRAGDWVVAAGGHLLQAGQKVRPIDRDNRPVKL